MLAILCINLFLLTAVILVGAITGPAVGLLLLATLLAVSFAVGFKIHKGIDNPSGIFFASNIVSLCLFSQISKSAVISRRFAINYHIRTCRATAKA